VRAIGLSPSGFVPVDERIMLMPFDTCQQTIDMTP
jgi:hypothetical protein